MPIKEAPPLPELLDVPAVAAWLDLSEATIRRLVREGKLPAYRADGIRTPLRFRRDELERWLESSRLHPETS